jgi:hypothetical protein
MDKKQTLVKELDEIVELTTKQNYHYVRGRKYLYEGFAAVYLWWHKAKKQRYLSNAAISSSNLQHASWSWVSS